MPFLSEEISNVLVPVRRVIGILLSELLESVRPSGLVFKEGFFQPSPRRESLRGLLRTPPPAELLSPLRWKQSEGQGWLGMFRHSQQLFWHAAYSVHPLQ